MSALHRSSPYTTTTEAKPTPAYVPTAFAVKVSGSGRPVIFIPGLASPGSIWDATVAHLDGKVQSHVITLAGFAGVPLIAPPFLSMVHAQISDYIAKNNLVRPIIVGHSMGGMMALWLAETIADLGAVVDVDASPFLAGETHPLMTEAQAIAESISMRDQMLSLSPTQLEEQIRQSMRGGIGTREDFDRVVAEAAKRDVDLVFIAARHFVMLDQPDAFYALLDKAIASAT